MSIATVFPRFEDYRFVTMGDRLLFLPLGSIGRRWMPDAFVVDPEVKTRFERRTARMTVVAITLPVAAAVVTAGESLTLGRLLVVWALAAAVALVAFALRIRLELADLKDRPRVPAPVLDADTRRAMARDRPPVGDAVLALAPTIWVGFLAGIWWDAGTGVIGDGSVRAVLTIVVVGLGIVSILQLLSRLRDLRAAATRR